MNVFSPALLCDQVILFAKLKIIWIFESLSAACKWKTSQTTSSLTFTICLTSLPLVGVSARTSSLRCGILSSASTSGCQPIRSAAVIPPVFWETSSPRATIMSTSSCFKGELRWERIISSSWANRSKALVMSWLTASCCCKDGRRWTKLHMQLFVSKMRYLLKGMLTFLTVSLCDVWCWNDKSVKRFSIFAVFSFSNVRVGYFSLFSVVVYCKSLGFGLLVRLNEQFIDFTVEFFWHHY